MAPEAASRASTAPTSEVQYDVTLNFEGCKLSFSKKRHGQIDPASVPASFTVQLKYGVSGIIPGSVHIEGAEGVKRFAEGQAWTVVATLMVLYPPDTQLEQPVGGQWTSGCGRPQDRYECKLMDVRGQEGNRLAYIDAHPSKISPFSKAFHCEGILALNGILNSIKTESIENINHMTLKRTIALQHLSSNPRSH